MVDASNPEIVVDTYSITLGDREISDPVTGVYGGTDHDTISTDLDLSELSSDEDTEDPNAFLSPNLWNSYRKRAKKRRSKQFLNNGKEIARYIRNAGNLNTALLKIISKTDSAKGKVCLYVAELLQKGASVSATDEDGNTPLHLAALRGLSDIAKDLLHAGADPHTENKKHKTPLEIAIHQALEGPQESVDDYNAFATLMVHEMDAPNVRAMFLYDCGNPPKLSFHALLDNDHLMDIVSAVLDKLIQRVPGRRRTYNVYYDLLEANTHGIVSSPKKFSLHRHRHGRSAFEQIAWTGNKEAVSHLAVRLLMQSKWKRFARNFLIIHFVYWVITMLAISLALILAASQPDPQNYDHPLDTFRAVCEGAAILLVSFASLKEIYHIYLWRLSYFLDYSFFFYGYLNLATLLFIVIVIPLRALDIDEQWITSSFLYICYAVRVLRYVSTVKFLGRYMQILFLIIKRDLVPFVCVLIILLFVFCGGFYFALREEVITPTLVTPQCNFSSVQDALSTFNLTVAEVEAAINNSTTPFMTSLDINFDETSTYPRVFFTGIRLAVEGENFLTYFGENGFGWLGVTTYVIFLFFVEVILLNMLIAQMSDTFSNVQGDAERSYAVNLARTIINIEKTGLSFLKCAFNFYVAKEKWTNPRRHVEKLDKTSLTNIHRIVLRSQKVLSQSAGELCETRDQLNEQNVAINKQLDLIMQKLTELERIKRHM